MNKKLFKQIKNEWRSNLWMFMELLVVSVVMWFVVDSLFVKVSVCSQDKGFDISHCYKLEMALLTDKSADYDPNDTLISQDILEICDRLRHRNGIEAVGLGLNSHPYNGNNSGTNVCYDTIWATQDGYIVRRMVTPDFINVFRYRGAKGETSEQLAAKLNENTIMVSDDVFGDKIKGGAKTLVNKTLKWGEDTTHTYTLAASLQPIRYDDFTEGSQLTTFVGYLRDSWINNSTELCIRVRPDYDVDFASTLLKDSEKQYRIGNVFISNVKSFKDIRRTYQQGQMNMFNLYVWGMGFLLLNIFLGLLGTFWFRTQQRRGEIALLKSFGGTNGSVFMRLICEGLLILTISTIPAVIIDFNIAHADLTEMYNNLTFEPLRFIITILASYFLIALMMVIGIAIPARKAMKIDPAEALHEE